MSQKREFVGFTILELWKKLHGMLHSSFTADLFFFKTINAVIKIY